jgi:Domain of unknown function (DUF5655)
MSMPPFEPRSATSKPPTASPSSLRRRKQFAMIQPSTTSRIDLGLILPTTMPAAGRLEPAATFNPLFTHRVRITAAADLDDELRGWLATACELAGQPRGNRSGSDELHSA